MSKNLYNTLKGLEILRNKQIESEGACSGKRFIHGNEYQESHYEICARRDECDLYKAYMTLLQNRITHNCHTTKKYYEVKRWVQLSTPKIWRKCQPYTKPKDN